MRNLLALLVCCAVLVGACTPESARPLPESMRVTPDERLIGTWRARLLGNDHVAVVSAGDRGTLEVRLTTHAVGNSRPEDAITSRHVLAFYQFHGRRLLVERGPSLFDHKPVYRFADYDIAADGTLMLRFLSEDAFDRVAKPVGLRMEIRGRDPVFRDLLVTDYAETTAAVLGTRPVAELFALSYGPFVRQ